MTEKQIKERARIRTYLKQIETYAKLCLEEMDGKSADTYYVDQKLQEIQRTADVTQMLVREYEDLCEEEE